MTKVIDEIIDNDINKIRDNNKKIPEIVNYLKGIELPKKEKKVTIEESKKPEEVPEVVIVKEKEYNDNEKKWLKILDKLGEVNE